MEDRVIPDVMNHVFLPQGRYPENFNSSQFKCLQKFCHWKCVKKGGTWRTLMGFLTGDLEDRVILDTMDDLGATRGSYPEGFVLLSLFLPEIYKLVCVRNVMSRRRILKVPDSRHGEQGHPWHQGSPL